MPSPLSTSTPVTLASMTSTPQIQIPTVSSSVSPEHSVKVTYVPSSHVPSPAITLVPSSEARSDPTSGKSNLPSFESTKRPFLIPSANMTAPTSVSLSPETQAPSEVPSDRISSSSPIPTPSYDPSSEFSLSPSPGYTSSHTPSQNPSGTPISITTDPSNNVLVTGPSSVPSIHSILTTSPGLGSAPIFLTSLPSSQQSFEPVSSKPELRGPTCAIDGAGIYGDDLGFVSRLDYGYELTVPSATTVEKVDIILAHIEKDITNALLSTFYFLPDFVQLNRTWGKEKDVQPGCAFWFRKCSSGCHLSRNELPGSSGRRKQMFCFGWSKLLIYTRAPEYD